MSNLWLLAPVGLYTWFVAWVAWNLGRMHGELKPRFVETMIDQEVDFD